MSQIEIPIEDLSTDVLGDDPAFRFEELLNDINRNDLDKIIHEHLKLDINADHINDYEVRDDMFILYVDNYDTQ